MVQRRPAGRRKVAAGKTSAPLPRPLRIFVYRPGAIGDTILTLPALAALRRRYPGCEITYAGNDAMLPLLPVEHTLSADDIRLLPLFVEPPRPWADFDLHVTFARLPFGLQRDPLQAVARQAHMVDWLVDAIDPTFGHRIPQLEATPGRGQPLVLHPGAGSKAKRWPAERFAAVARALARPAAIVRGPADQDAIDELLPQLDGEVEVWANLSLSELASRIAASRLFIGNDSGITHLAAALGVPTVAIYLSTPPSVWGIRGPRSRQAAGADVSVATVLAAGKMA